MFKGLMVIGARINPVSVRNAMGGGGVMQQNSIHNMFVNNTLNPLIIICFSSQKFIIYYMDAFVSRQKENTK